jgi:hypothetical protein
MTACSNGNVAGEGGTVFGSLGGRAVQPRIAKVFMPVREVRFGKTMRTAET